MKRLEFLEKAREVHGYRYKYLNLPEKITLNDRVEIEYKNVLYNQSVSKHLLGRRPERVVIKKTTEEFIKKAKEVWGDKYDYSLVDYKGALLNVKIMFNNIVYEQRAQSHLDGLAPEFRKNEESILKSRLKELDSPGETEIENFLMKFNLEYKREYKENLIEFDFYLPRIRTVIEFDGRQHFEPIEEFGGVGTFDMIKFYDNKKEKYCEDKFINIIRIKYDQIEDIYSILWENLSWFIKLKRPD